MDLLKQYLKRVEKDSQETDRIDVRVYSDILGSCLYIAETDEDLHALKSKGVSEPIYTSDEIQKLKGLSKDSLKEIHKVKEIFEDSKVEEIKEW